MEEDNEPDGGALWDGECRGGPLDGLTATSRFPSGFLLVDKPGQRCWVYDWMGDEARVFMARENGTPYALNEEGRWRAADEHTYDVRAYEPEPLEPEVQA